MTARNLPAKIQRRVDHILFLKEQLSQWQTLSEDQLIAYVKQYEKACLVEFALAYRPLFQDEAFAKTLLDIAYHCSANDQLTRSFINAYGLMQERYQLAEHPDWYQYFKENRLKNKGIGLAVAFFLRNMVCFHRDPDKWDYILAIPQLKPKKMAIEHFRYFFKSPLIDDLPIAHAEQAIAILEGWNREFIDQPIMVQLNTIVIETITEKAMQTHA